MLYMQEQIPNAKKENPEAGGPQLVAIISKSWKELSDAEKKVRIVAVDVTHPILLC
jgi:hypothetical protein